MPRYSLAVVLAASAFVFACGGGGSNPTAPSTAAATTPTRSMVLGGNLSFGAVTLNTTATGLLTISNTGNATLTVSAISGPCGTMFHVNFTAGAIQAGQTQNVVVQFTPTGVVNCAGSITVTADQTSGNNVIPMSASGSLNGIPLFTMSGVGNNVFSLPTYITRLHIVGTYTGTCCSNFIVHVNGAHIVNDLIGPVYGRTVSDGVYVVTAGTVEILSSDGVAWTFTEVRQ